MEPKPRSNSGVGIRAETFLSETFLNFCHVFPLLWVIQIFISLKKIQKYLVFGNKFGFRGPLMMEKIGNWIFPQKSGFSIGPKVSANLGFGIGIRPKPKQWFRSYTKGCMIQQRAEFLQGLQALSQLWPRIGNSFEILHILINAR